MNTIRSHITTTALALLALPALGIGGEPAPPPRSAQNQDVERRLEDARRRLEMAASEVARLSGQLGRDFALRFGTAGAGQAGLEFAPRALLGVVIDQNGQKDGAHVREVSPGGAAAESGIKVGDVITSIGGQDLTKESDPGRALVDRMQQAEPNLTVQVGVLRDGRKMNFDITPRPAPFSFTIGQAFGPPSEPPGQPGARGGRGAPGGPDVLTERRIEIRTNGEGPDDGARFAGLEFATLSEKLGSYFGVKSGVLVVRAGGNAAFKLQDGDVILQIDGREPSSAQHAGRILRSYGNGERLKLRVQRDRKAQDIEITMPNVPAERRLPDSLRFDPGPLPPRN